MSRKKELVKNTAIVFIGKLFTQFISFLLIPLYTFYLNTESYGYIDLVQTYIMIIVPTLILRFDSSIFRYLIDARENDEKKKEIISSSIFILFIQLGLFIVISLLLKNIFNIKYIVMIIINVIVLSISNVMLQIPRGNGKMLNYSISSIICGVSTTIFNALFIAVLKYDASYILLSSSLGNLLCCIYIFFSEKLYRYILINSFNKNISKEMIKYSLPLIPDGLSWWIVHASDRTIISIFLGATFNGIYAVSCKFSNILATFFTIFNLTWQESASVHINDKDKDKFFSEIFNSSFKIFSTLCVGIMVCIPFAYKFMVGKDFLESNIYIPILLVGNLFNAMANVTGGIYIALKDTKKVAKTTILGALINITINLLFIRKIGLWAATISTAIAYIIVCIYRFIDIRKVIKLSLNIKEFFLLSVYVIVSIVIFYIQNNLLNILNFVITCIFFIIVNKELIKKIYYQKVRRKIYE